MKINTSSSKLETQCNFRITVAANQGGRKYMEDRVHIEKVTNSDGTIKFMFFGVFDGHGGYEASEYVRRNLLANIMACEQFDSDKDEAVLEAIKEGFLTTHDEMRKVVDTWPRTASGYSSTAGTTCSVAIIRNRKIYTGHVGDSAIIMGKYQTTIDGKIGFETERLTVDHKPESLEEITRIELSGGRVAQKSGVSRVVWTRPLRGHMGPVRKTTPTESIPFLAVARSLGDLWSFCEETGKYVVSPVPDVAVRLLTEEDSSIVLVSDGITNVLSAVQIIQFVEGEEKKLLVTTGKDPKDLHEKQPNHARTLLSNALKRWGHLRADNLSAIVIMMDPLTTRPEAYDAFRDEDLDANQSVDEMFLMDPECMIHVTTNKTEKLWTERVPLLYEGALDNNFAAVDYRGPGFMTHDEEDEIEARMLMRERLRASFKQEKDEASTNGAKENLDVTPAKDEDSHSDEEEPNSSEVFVPSDSLLSKTSPRTRSSAKHIVEISGTPTRKIAVATRRLSIMRADSNVGTLMLEEDSLTVSTQILTRSHGKTESTVFSTASVSTPVQNAFTEFGSRKRPSRLTSTSSGVTPSIEKLKIKTPARPDEPIVRSEPSTPAKKLDEHPFRGSNWSLSKLDQIRSVHEETLEPPSKMRRVFGFMKKLVGLGHAS